MLTKENYIQYRKRFTGKVLPEMLYEYYLDHNRPDLNPLRYDGQTMEFGATQFEIYFADFLNSLSPIVREAIVNRIVNHFDKKFNVVKTVDAYGKTIKVELYEDPTGDIARQETVSSTEDKGVREEV